jgi:hypothetical protein
MNHKKGIKKKSNKSKKMGNNFERKIAKELSIWMFNDPHVLKREPTSGANKHTYIGDIIPMKQINWHYWPFNIETKYGYYKRRPTLLNYDIVRKWLLKAYYQSDNHNTQKLVLLICNFKTRRGILVFTNKVLNNIYWRSIIHFKDSNNQRQFCYIYDYDELLMNDFEDIFAEC